MEELNRGVTARVAASWHSRREGPCRHCFEAVAGRQRRRHGRAFPRGVPSREAVARLRGHDEHQRPPNAEGRRGGARRALPPLPAAVAGTMARRTGSQPPGDRQPGPDDLQRARRTLPPGGGLDPTRRSTPCRCGRRRCDAPDGTRRCCGPLPVKIYSQPEPLRPLRSTVRLAQAVGPRLGRGAILLRGLPPIETPRPRMTRRSFARPKHLEGARGGPSRNEAHRG